MSRPQKITTFIWFDNQAEEAATLYTSLFADSRITRVARWGAGGPAPAGSVMTVAFELAGQGFIALNGGPVYQLTPAFSLVVDCRTQDELDRYWEALTAGGGKESRCGWLVDRFGVSWQLVPEDLGELMTGTDANASARVGKALMGMYKLDIAALRRAHAGE